MRVFAVIFQVVNYLLLILLALVQFELFDIFSISLPLQDPNFMNIAFWLFPSLTTVTAVLTFGFWKSATNSLRGWLFISLLLNTVSWISIIWISIIWISIPDLSNIMINDRLFDSVPLYFSAFWFAVLVNNIVMARQLLVVDANHEGGMTTLTRAVLKRFSYSFQAVNFLTVAVGLVFLNNELDLYSFNFHFGDLLSYIMITACPILTMASLVFAISFWDKITSRFRTWFIITTILNAVGWPLFVLAVAFGIGNSPIYSVQVVIATLYFFVVTNNFTNFKLCLGRMKEEKQETYYRTDTPMPVG